MTLGILDRFRARSDRGGSAVIEGLSQARAYWEGLRRDGMLPSRTSIDPRGFAGVLDRVFLADRIGRGVARVRIAGSAVNAFAGADIRGLPLGCLFDAASRGALGDTLEEVFAAPAIVEIELGSARRPGAGPIGRLLLMPLDDDGAGRLALGVIGFADPTPSACKLIVRSCRAERVVLTPGPQAAHVPASAVIRKVGHLSLVHSV